MSSDPGTSPTPRISLSLLGPLQLQVHTRVVDITAEKERTVIAVLGLAGDEGVSTLALIDELWESPTPSSKGTLQTYVSNVRKLLRPDGAPAVEPVLERVGDRYRFVPGAVMVDVQTFRTHLTKVRATLAESAPDREFALTQVNLALTCVRGQLDPMIVKGTGLLAAESARLRDESLEARWIWADLEIQAGRAAAVVGELRAIVDDDPTEERFWRQLMLAYWKTGRQQMALDAYQQVRSVLAEELGVLPDPSLQDLEQAILRHDPQLGQPIGSVESAPLAPTRPRGRIAQTLNSFVGRSDELEKICTLLATHSLVTLRGGGGSGKTRLAREVAHVMQEEFSGGAWWVEFGEVVAGDPSARANVVDNIATAVGLIRRSQGSLDDALVAQLDETPTLIVLDNSEHIVDAVADVVGLLLGSCPDLTILTTTREALRVVGEVIVPIEPLGTDGDNTIPPAARLFFDRADPIEGRLERDPESRQIVIEICRQLDGLPLALELAAALVETTPLAEILAELGEHRFELLNTGSRGATAHHRTLAAVVDWSFDRLQRDEQEFFASISMFPGSFNVAGAASIAGVDAFEARRLLAVLVRKSIVGTVRSGHGVERYRLLETLRDYGLRQLKAQERHESVERRLIEHSVELTQHAAYDPTTSVVVWFERLGPDIANLRLAIRRSMETKAIDDALSMIDAFHWYYNYVGSLTETKQWLHDLVGADASGKIEVANNPRGLSSEQLVMAYTSLASLANLGGSYRETSQWADLAVVAARGHGDVRRRIAALVIRGATAVFENRQDVAVEAFVESLDLSTELGDRWGRATAMAFMAVGSRRSADEQRRTDPASAWMTRLMEIGQQFERAYELFSQVSDDRGMALVLINLGRIEEHKGDLTRAVALCDRGLALAENNGDKVVSALARVFRGRMSILLGDEVHAVECFSRALTHCSSPEEHRVVFSSAAEWLGIIAARNGDDEPLLRIAAATEVYREAPRTAAALPELYAERDRIRVELGAQRSNDLEDDGRHMRPEAVKALAIRAATAAVGSTNQPVPRAFDH